MIGEGMYREKTTRAGLKIAEGGATDLVTGETKPIGEIDEAKYEKMNLLTKLRDVLQGIKQHGLGTPFKIE